MQTLSGLPGATVLELAGVAQGGCFAQSQYFRQKEHQVLMQMKDFPGHAPSDGSQSNRSSPAMTEQPFIGQTPDGSCDGRQTCPQLAGYIGNPHSISTLFVLEA